MTENKGMDHSPIKIAQWVGAKGSRWKNALNHDYKNNHNFQFTKFSFIIFTNRSNLSGKRPHRPVANLLVANFRSQAICDLIGV